LQVAVQLTALFSMPIIYEHRSDVLDQPKDLGNQLSHFQ